MRRGNGFVHVFSGIMLALILVLGVCGGVGAGEPPKSTEKNNAYRIWQIERDVFKLDTKIDNIYDMQILKLERTNENIRNIKEWVASEKESAEFFSNILSITATFMAAWVTVFGIIVTVLGYLNVKQQKNTAKEASEAFEKELSQTKAEFKRNAKTQQETIENDKNKFEEKLKALIAEKRSEIDSLVKRCEELKLICENNACKTDEVLSDAEQKVKNFNNSREAKDMDDETKKAVRDVALSKIDEIYTHLKAKALAHEINGEWDKAVKLWQALNQEFPSNPESNFRLAYTLERITNKTNRDALLSEANRLYKRTTELSPTDLHSMSFNNWGHNIFITIRKDSSDKVTESLSEAENLFKKSITEDQRNPYPYINLGWLQFKKATEFTPEIPQQEKKDLLNKAIKNFQKTIILDEKFFLAWTDWGLALIELAIIEEDSDTSKTLLNEAEKKLKNNVASEYNLAKIASARARTNDCKTHLIVAKIQKVIPPFFEFEKDLRYFKNVRNEQWFKDFLEELRQEEQETAAKQAKSDEEDTDTEK